MGQIKNIKLHIVTDIKRQKIQITSMGKPQRKKRTHKNIKDFKKKHRTRKRKDIDEIHDHMKPNRIDSYLHQIIDPDLPGEGQFYCLHCARILSTRNVSLNTKKQRIIRKDYGYL